MSLTGLGNIFRMGEEGRKDRWGHWFRRGGKVFRFVLRVLIGSWRRSMSIR